jgi:hypothetical protein
MMKIHKRTLGRKGTAFPHCRGRVAARSQPLLLARSQPEKSLTARARGR